MSCDPVGFTGFNVFSDDDGENAKPTRQDLLRKLIKEATGRDNVDNLINNHGCWCRKGGEGKYVDNIDL